MCDLSRRSATAIDVLCRAKDGALVVVEVKTRIVCMARHTEEYKRVHPTKPHVRTTVQNELRKVPNSLYYRHQIQLANTTYMFQKSKMAKNKRVLGVIVVLVEDHALEYPLVF